MKIVRSKATPPLTSVKQLLLEHDIDQYPYSPGGSSFLVFFEAGLFLVTAKHCLENNEATAEQVFILDGSDGRTCLAFDRLSKGHEESDDKDFADFAIFRVRQNTIDGTQLRNLQPFPINERTIIQPQDSRVKSLVVSGFPLDMNAPDYEKKCIIPKRLTLNGVYEKRGLDSHIHIMRYAEDGGSIEGTDGNGMSGGAVFAHVPSAPMPLQFAGMTLRGGHKSGIWQFVSSIVLWSALKDLSRRGEVIPIGRDLINLVIDYGQLDAPPRKDPI